MLGKQMFTSTCAGCHGLDGRGGERAPNIADRPDVEQLSDAKIFGIIRNGIAGTGMPAFHSLESSQIKSIVSYLRVLQGAKTTVRLPGDPTHGKAIFFGKGKCSDCHMVSGAGGFIASDLSDYASFHAVDQIRSAIIQQVAGSTQVRLATVTMRGGEKYVGRVRNEDNFSLQLQTLEGTFYFLSKSDLESMEYSSQTLMPATYGSTLSPAELNDIISYLIDTTSGRNAASTVKVNDWEQ